MNIENETPAIKMDFTGDDFTDPDAVDTERPPAPDPEPAAAAWSIRDLRDAIMSLQGSAVAYNVLGDQQSEMTCLIAVEFFTDTVRAFGERSLCSQEVFEEVYSTAAMAAAIGETPEIMRAKIADMPHVKAKPALCEFDFDPVTAREAYVGACMLASLLESTLIQFRRGTLSLEWFAHQTDGLDQLNRVLEYLPPHEPVAGLSLGALCAPQDLGDLDL